MVYHFHANDKEKTSSYLHQNPRTAIKYADMVFAIPPFSQCQIFATKAEVHSCKEEKKKKIYLNVQGSCLAVVISSHIFVKFCHNSPKKQHNIPGA